MALVDLWSIELVVAAFAGGAFGAAIGALPSFALAGVMVIAGEIYDLAASGFAGGNAAGYAAVDVTGAIGFGPVLSPHIAFGGGAAAVAYAARKDYLDDDFDYHPAKNVTRGLGTRPDLLAVGGAFGVVGHWVATLSASLAVPTDPVALGVVGSALVHRLAFGYHLVGDVRTGLLDMRPFEKGERREERVAADGGSGSRYVVEPWLPHQYRWPGVALLGVTVGVLGGYVAYVTTSPFLAFGISVASLLYVNAGVREIPITHHITLPASTAVLAFAPLSGAALTPAALAAAVPLWVALALGGGFGLVGALAGEFLQRILYAHAETHLDPPAASIVVTTFLIAVLATAGVLHDAAWVPTP
jgi:hypothetical protein